MIQITKTHKNKIAIFSILILMVACRPKPLSISVPQKESSIVVYSQIVPNAAMFVALTRSFGALDFGDGDSMSRNFINQILVDSALVTISYNNKIDTLQKLTSGVYSSLNILQIPNTIYTLKATDFTNKQTITASAKMLEQVTFDKVIPKINKNKQDTSLTIDLTFKDKTGSNWYMLNIYNKQSFGTGLDVDSYFENGENTLTSTYLYSDYDADKNGVISKTLEISKTQLLNMNLSQSDTIAITLSNISYDYYNYIVLRKKAGGLLSQITSEPIKYPTNVNNGYGFFNTHYPDIKIFDLNKY